MTAARVERCHHDRCVSCSKPGRESRMTISEAGGHLCCNEHVRHELALNDDALRVTP